MCILSMSDYISIQSLYHCKRLCVTIAQCVRGYYYNTLILVFYTRCVHGEIVTPSDFF